MNNLEIVELIKEIKIKNFIGVFIRDEIPLNLSDNFYFIYNYQTSKEHGEHWAVFIRKNKKNYHSSSFGDDPCKEITDQYKNIMTSTFRFQGYFEKSCGLFCVLLIYLIENGNSFEDSVLSMLHYN